MNHLKLTLTALLTAALVVTSLPFQALAQSQSGIQPFRSTTKLKVKNPDTEPIDLTNSLYTEAFTKPENWTNYDKSIVEVFRNSFKKALDGGNWAFVQGKYPDKDYYHVRIFWTENQVSGLKLFYHNGLYNLCSTTSDGFYSLDVYWYQNRPTMSSGSLNGSLYSCIPLSGHWSGLDYSTFLSNFEYTKSKELDGVDVVIPQANSSVRAENISPNFTIEVENRTIQVQHIKEFDRIPGYENDKPVVEAFLKKCNKVVTHRDLNPNALSHEALENVFGFVKMATDPLVDVGNFVVTKISPNSPELGKIPERERDRILWCSEPEIVKTDYVDLGSLLRYEIADYGYYLISLKYLTEHRHSYNSTITPDYVYYQTPDSNDKYDYDPREVVFNADGKTFSNDTRNLNCDSSGFCEIPPDEKDCSYDAQGSWAKVVSCHIGNFMTGLGNFMKWLFIPDSLSVYNSFNTMLDNLKKSFGFISLPFTLIPDIWSLVNQGSALGPNCSTPPLTVFGASASIELCSWRQHFPRAWSFMQLTVQGGIALYFLWVLYRLLMQFFGTSVGDSVDDDSEYEEVRWRDDRTGDVGSWERRRK